METLPWNEHLDRLEWKQGDHITLVGTTGCGKTTLAQALLPKRKFVLILATKPKDPVISQFKADGFKVMRDWFIFDPNTTPRILLWPRPEKSIRATRAKQKELFSQVLEDAFNAGGWCVYVDEAQYFTSDLKLEPELAHIWQMGRAIKLSLVVGNQRPRHIPLAAYSQAQHLYVWGNRDRQDLKRISNISGFYDPREIERTLQTLPSKHHCLYIGEEGDNMHVTIVD